VLLTNALNRSQARWDSNTCALSLRYNICACVAALYAGVGTKTLPPRWLATNKNGYLM